MPKKSKNKNNSKDKENSNKTVSKKKVKDTLLSVDREGMKELVNYLEKETDYFKAPASSRFHEVREKGLITHSWNVYTLLKEKNERFNLNIPEDTMIITGLLHDLCKCDIYEDNILKNGERGKWPYNKNEGLPLGHCTKSIFIISKFMDLTHQEALMIRWHMSWSDYEFKKHINQVKDKNPAVMVMITSDIEASDFLDEQYGK